MGQEYCTLNQKVVDAKKCVACDRLEEIQKGLEGTIWDCEYLYQKMTPGGPFMFIDSRLRADKKKLSVGDMVKHHYSEFEMRKFFPLSNIPKRIRTYNPQEPKYQGGDAAVIAVQGDKYVIIYLFAEVDGLAQAVKSDMNSLIAFNGINIEYFIDFIVPLTKDIQERGLVAIIELGITN